MLLGFLGAVHVRLRRVDASGVLSTVAVVLGLRMAGTSPWRQRVGLVQLPISLLGSATLISDALFPVLALGTLGYELWVGALAWHWLRSERHVATVTSP